MARNRYLLRRKSILIVQRVVRRMLVMKKLERRNLATVAIQRAVNRLFQRRNEARSDVREEKSTKAQNRPRGGSRKNRQRPKVRSSAGRQKKRRRRNCNSAGGRKRRTAASSTVAVVPDRSSSKDAVTKGVGQRRDGRVGSNEKNRNEQRRATTGTKKPR